MAEEGRGKVEEEESVQLLRGMKICTDGDCVLVLLHPEEEEEEN